MTARSSPRNEGELFRAGGANKLPFNPALNRNKILLAQVRGLRHYSETADCRKISGVEECL